MTVRIQVARGTPMRTINMGRKRTSVTTIGMFNILAENLYKWDNNGNV